MHWTRRHFVTASSLALMGSAVRGLPAFAQQPPLPAVTPVFAPVRGNVGTFFARGGTIGTLITPDALVVVDAQFPDTAAMLLDGLKTRSTRRIDLLINTHYHQDHTSGHPVIRPMATRIGASPHARKLLEAEAAAANANASLTRGLPDTTIDTGWKQDVGGEIVSAKYYGPAHTAGDLVLFFERANVVHLADVMSYLRTPRIDLPGGASARNHLIVLENVVRDYGNDTIFIFGHSKAGERLTGTRADLLLMRDYLTAMLDYVRKGIAAGRSRDEIVKAATLPGFESWERPASGALEPAYDELTGRS